MALAQLLNVPIHTWPASDSFRYIRDFLACRNGIADFTPSGPNPGPGYEIVDEYYAAAQNPLMSGDLCVFKSFGEANSYPHYLKLTFGANTHGMAVYLHWDAATHTGWAGAGANAGTIHFDNYQGVLSIHADLDELHIITQYRQGSNVIANRHQAFGRLKPDMTLYDGTAARCETVILPSANQIIRLDIWPTWAAVGRKIFNWDTKSAHILTITGVNEAARTITVANSFDKDAGSRLAEDLCIFAYVAGTTANSGDALGTANLYQTGPGRGILSTPRTTNTRVFTSNIATLTDMHYGHRLGGDVWLGTEAANTQSVYGRFALMKQTSLVENAIMLPNDHGYAWVDETTGQAWRSYRCYNNRWVALKEAT